MSSGLTMLKREESSVPLPLEPAPHRVNIDTTVLAIETREDDSKAEEAEYGYPITCGDSSAVLLIKKFICPGINVPCVKFQNDVISPKQFVHVSGKATLKDWKRAIRLGGVMLRKMMDSGQIDFYQHSSMCSNTCRSSKCDTPTSRASQAAVPRSPLSVSGEDLNDATGAEEKCSPGTEAKQSTATNGHAAKRERSESPDGVLRLWRSVSESGLMGNVLSSVEAKLLLTLKEIEARGLKNDLQLQDAVLLNKLCEMFGLCESVEQALELRRHLSEENRMHNGLYGMDGIGNGRKRKKMGKSSSKQPRVQGSGSLSCLTMLSPLRASPVLFPLLALGLSEQHFTHFQTALSGQLSDKCSGTKVKREETLREKSNSRRQGEDEEESPSTGSAGRQIQHRVQEVDSHS
ncbi:unnamed protein product [Knipowitschia caucasica]